MPYHWTTGIIGLQPITAVDDVKKHKVGTTAKAYDVNYGEGEFIYLPGVANLIAGDCVIYDTDAEVVVRTRSSAPTRGPMAVAMAAVSSPSLYGWFQIRGAAVVNCIATVTSGMSVFITATDGKVADDVLANALIEGALFKTADGTPAAGQAIVQITYPCPNLFTEPV